MTTMKIELEEFLSECIVRDSGYDGLYLSELYGLYVSWCAVKNMTPVSQGTLVTALRASGIRPVGHGPCPGMAMSGPAARDYIVHRELPLYPLTADRAKYPPAARELTPGRQKASRTQPSRATPDSHHPAA
jgi:hypothetical protein